MTMFTLVQVIGNVYSSYKYIITNSVENLRYFKEPIFIWTKNLPDDQATVIIVYLVGALLPIAALLLTSMVTNYLSDQEALQKDQEELELGEEVGDETKDDDDEKKIKPNEPKKCTNSMSKKEEFCHRVTSSYPKTPIETKAVEISKVSSETDVTTNLSKSPNCHENLTEELMLTVQAKTDEVPSLTAKTQKRIFDDDVEAFRIRKKVASSVSTIHKTKLPNKEVGVSIVFLENGIFYENSKTIKKEN